LTFLTNQKKLIIIYKNKVEIGNIYIYMIFVLDEFLKEDDDSSFVNDIKTIISLHLNQISITLNSYFPKDIRDDFQWIENPFTVSIEELNSKLFLELRLSNFLVIKFMKINYKMKLL